MHKLGTGFNKINSSGAGGAHIGFFGRPRIHMGPNDGAGGGGGGQGGAGGGQGGDGGAGAQSALSEDAKKEVAELVNSAVTGAVTNHLGRFKKSFTEEITKTLGDTMSPIAEQIKAMSERQAQQQPQGGGKGGQGGASDAQSQEMRDSLLRYENRIKELEQQNKAERDAREVEKATRLREEERNKLSTVLNERGIPASQVRAAVALLHTEDKRVARTDDGRIVFKFERGSGQGKYVDELEVDKGVDEWLKSDEGKAYLPARQANGSGGQPARQGTVGNTPGEKRQQATQDLAKILLGGGG